MSNGEVGAAPADEAAALEALRYPIGRFQRTAEPSVEQRKEWLEAVRALPAHLSAAVAGLDERQLERPYRPGGWTVRQVVHHVADSHVNAYVRFSLALAEEGRSVATYDEKRWAEQPFARTGPLEPTLRLLEGLHARWVAMLEAVPESAFRRTIAHPEWGTMTVDDLLSLYAWHSRHHVAHINNSNNDNNDNN